MRRARRLRDRRPPRMGLSPLAEQRGPPQVLLPRRRQLVDGLRLLERQGLEAAQDRRLPQPPQRRGHLLRREALLPQLLLHLAPVEIAAAVAVHDVTLDLALRRFLWG